MITCRAKDIPPFIVMDVLERAQEMERSGVDVVHLEIGEPDFDTPECIKEAGRRAMAEGHTHYTHSLGLIELREGGGRRLPAAVRRRRLPRPTSSSAPAPRRPCS